MNVILFEVSLQSDLSQTRRASPLGHVRLATKLSTITIMVIEITAGVIMKLTR